MAEFEMAEQHDTDCRVAEESIEQLNIEVYYSRRTATTTSDIDNEITDETERSVEPRDPRGPAALAATDT
eukprot:9051246-Heterocapsa_arctica.AAC.1